MRFECGGEVIGGRPEYVNWGLGWHQLVLGRVERFENDKPKELTLVDKDEVVDVKGMPTFVTTYIAVEALGIDPKTIPNKGVMKAVPNT